MHRTHTSFTLFWSTNKLHDIAIKCPYRRHNNTHFLCNLSSSQLSLPLSVLAGLMTVLTSCSVYLPVSYLCHSVSLLGWWQYLHSVRCISQSAISATQCPCWVDDSTYILFSASPSQQWYPWLLAYDWIDERTWRLTNPSSPAFFMGEAIVLPMNIADRIQMIFIF